MIEQGVRNLILDVVPMLGAFFQGIRQVALNFYCVIARRRAARIDNARTNDLKARRVVEVELSPSIHVTKIQEVIKSGRYNSLTRRNRTASSAKRIFRWFRRRVVKADHGVFGLKHLHAFEKILSPQFAGGHFYQVLIMNCWDTE